MNKYIIDTIRTINVSITHRKLRFSFFLVLSITCKQMLAKPLSKRTAKHMDSIFHQ